MRAGIGKMLDVTVIWVWCLWLIGQVARDSNWVSALFFYVPSPVIFALLLVYGLHAWCRTQRRFATACLLLALVALCFILFVENRWMSGSDACGKTAALRLVHWNVFKGHLGWNGMMSQLKEQDADIYVLSEVPKDRDAEYLAQALGHGYEARRMGHMAIIVRGRVENCQPLCETRDLQVYRAVCRAGESGLSLFAVDLGSSSTMSRAPYLRKVVAMMKEHRPDIVVGDFNAPRRSLTLSELPEGYSHGYDAAGRGWSYTWPVPFPCLAIDQCMLGPRIAPLKYRLATSLQSDHRRQALDFSVNSSDILPNEEEAVR